MFLPQALKNWYNTRNIATVVDFQYKKVFQGFETANFFDFIRIDHAATPFIHSNDGHC